jgi:thioredoxin reductase (NADPH)
MTIDTGSTARAKRDEPDEERERPGAERSAPEALPADYDVVVIGGGPAGLAAGAFCGRKFLRTAVLEGNSWGGILMRWCPDKRIDNYPGLRPGILARELARFLLDDAQRARVDLIGERARAISRDGVVQAGDVRLRAKALILATGSTAAEAEIAGEKEFADRGRGVHYAVRTPSRFHGRRVVVVGGGDTAVSVVQRIQGIASRITLVHRQETLRAVHGLPGGLTSGDGVEILLRCAVVAIFGGRSVEGVRVRDLATGEERGIPADAVVLAVGRRPNTAIFRDLHLAIDATGQVATDGWQRTNVPGILAVGDVSSPLKMIVTAVAQAAAAAHEAYRGIRAPYWK